MTGRILLRSGPNFCTQMRLTNRLRVVGLIIFLFTLPGYSQGPVSKSDAEKWREDLAYMAEQMPLKHKNLFHSMRREQFDSAVNDLDEKIATMSREQIIVGMAKIVAMVGDGHTNIAPTRDPKIGFHSLPIKFYFFKNGLYVRAAAKEYAGLVG